MADENGEELQKMIVRLMGDDTHLQNTLDHSVKITQEWKGEIEGVSEEAMAVESAFSSWAGPLAVAGLGLMIVGDLVRKLRASWVQVTAEIEKGADANYFFTESTTNTIKEATDALDNWEEAALRAKAATSEFLAPAVAVVAQSMADIINSFRQGGVIASFTGNYDIEDIRAAIKEAKEVAANRNKIIGDSIIKDSIRKEQEAVDSLRVKLGEITEEQELIGDLYQKMADKGVEVNLELRKEYETLIKQRLEREKQLQLQKEQKRAAEQAAREEQRLIEQANKARERGNEQLAKDFDKRMQQGIKEAQEMAALNVERGKILAQLEEIRNSGVPISAGAAIEAGSVEGRSLTKFGTAAEKTNDLLKQLQRLEERELQLQEKAVGAIEAIRDDQPDVIHIA